MADLKRCDRCETVVDPAIAHSVVLIDDDGAEVVNQDLCETCATEVREFLEEGE